MKKLLLIMVFATFVAINYQTTSNNSIKQIMLTMPTIKAELPETINVQPDASQFEEQTDIAAKEAMNNMQKRSLYLNLATDYFDLDKPKATAAEYAFFRHYIANSTGPILEPMCGTGRYLIPYVEEGFNIEGFDISPFMLKALHTKCAEKNITPHVWEQFLEDMPTTKKYDLIFIPDSSFSLFLKPEHITICLQKIYDLLQKGGVFIFDVETIYAVSNDIGIWQGKTYKKPDGTVMLCSTLPLPIENSVATYVHRYELIDRTDIIKTEIEYFQIKLYYPTEMDTFLKEVGFSQIKRIAAYDHASSPAAHDYTIVYECIK